MLKRFVTLMALAAVAVCVLFYAGGCETEAQNSALLGTAIGAGIGALAGGDTEGALIGGAIGGGVGYMAGNESEKKKTQQKTQQQIANIQAQQNVVTVWITNSNGSQTPVKLTKDGPGYIGPRGERYASMPTEEQLKQVYGM
jgi:uncharacterized protein YcfJ